MALYIAIVLLAELITLTDPHGWQLAAIVWGTTIGLVVAHAFAFQVATHGLTGGRLPPADLAEIRAELIGATAIGVVATVPILLFRSSTEIEAVRFSLAVATGIVGYLVERTNDHGRLASVAFAAGILIVALAIAAFKTFITEH